MPKATKAQKQQRVRIVYEMLIADTPRPDILRYIAENWGLKTRSAEWYITQAYQLLSEEAARIQTEALAQHLAKRASLRHKALKDGDKRLAFEILRDETKLLGLYPAKQAQVTNLDIDLTQLSDAQLQRIADGEPPAIVLADKS